MRRLRWLAIGVGALVLAGILYVGIFGSVVVHDETGDVARAVVTNDREVQSLYRLPGGYFFAIPAMEGTVEVRCRNGSRTRSGYITGYTHLWLRAVGPTPCARLVER